MRHRLFATILCAVLFVIANQWTHAEVTDGGGSNADDSVYVTGLADGVSEPYCRYGKLPNGQCAQSSGRGTMVVAAAGGAITCGTAAICGTFNARLSKCGCKLGPPRITRQSRGKKSCHNSGRAIDVMSIYCGGKKYKGTTARYKQWVRCMAPSGGRRGVWSGGGMTVLFQQAHKKHLGVTQSHYDHAHFSIKCSGGYI